MSKKPIPRKSYRSPSGRYFRWSAIIHQSSLIPGIWWLVAPSVSASVLTQVRYRRHPALRLAEAELQAQGRNRHEVDGQQRIDLYCRLVLTPPQRNGPAS